MRTWRSGRARGDTLVSRGSWRKWSVSWCGSTHRLVGLRGLLRGGDGTQGREASGGARETIRRESAGPRGTERMLRGGGGRGRRGRVPGDDDGGVAPRIGKCVRTDTREDR